MEDYTSEYFVYAMRALQWLYPPKHPFQEAAWKAYSEHERWAPTIVVSTDQVQLESTQFQTRLMMRAKRNQEKHTFCLKPSITGLYTLEHLTSGTYNKHMTAREVVDYIQYILR